MVNAVDEVSFTIFPGETLGLVGESGCGKSTLARVMLRLIPPSGGKIFYNGHDITTLAQKELRKIRTKLQIIFQHPESALNPRMKIYDSLLEPMQIQGMLDTGQDEKKKAYELIESVGLKEEHLNRYPHELSGGQIQRVVLARILSLQPEFIVADEPTSMLDVSVQAQMLNLLKEIQKKFNLSYLFVSHDLEVVRWMSDRIAIMYGGGIVEIGQAEEVSEHPRHPYTQILVKAFLAFENGRHKFIKTPERSSDQFITEEFKSESPSGCKFYPYCPKAKDVCRKRPELEELKKDYYVACWQV